MPQFVSDAELQAILARCRETPISPMPPKMRKRTFWLVALFSALLPWRVLLPFMAGVAAVQSSEEDRR